MPLNNLIGTRNRPVFADTFSMILDSRQHGKRSLTEGSAQLVGLVLKNALCD
jgi:hypothetical protein